MPLARQHAVVVPAQQVVQHQLLLTLRRRQQPVDVHVDVAPDQIVDATRQLAAGRRRVQRGQHRRAGGGASGDGDQALTDQAAVESFFARKYIFLIEGEGGALADDADAIADLVLYGLRGKQ